MAESPSSPGPFYDPRAFGALCEQCPLKGAKVVPSEFHPDAKLTVVAEAPGKDEVVEGRPLVGASGKKLMQAMRSNALHRQDANYVNVISCRFKRPDAREDENVKTTDKGGDREKYDAWLQRVNRKRRVDGLEPVMHPIVACRNRFLYDIAKARAFILMGKTAIDAVSPGAGSMKDIRGTVMLIPRPDGPDMIPAVPTYHPAFVLRAPKWTGIFYNDINRAFRHAEGRAPWQEPQRVYAPSPEFLREFLKQSPLAWDVETMPPFDSPMPPKLVESMNVILNCIGIGNKDVVVIVPFVSKEQKDKKFYSAFDEAEVKRILIEWFEDANRVKIGHNSGLYDTLVMETLWGADGTPSCKWLM